MLQVSSKPHSIRIWS